MTHHVQIQWSDSGRNQVVDRNESEMGNVGLSNSNALEMSRQVLDHLPFPDGAGEWYYGYHPLPLGRDDRLEAVQTREEAWRYSRIDPDFLEEHCSLADATPRDHLVMSRASQFARAVTFLDPNS